MLKAGTQPYAEQVTVADNFKRSILDYCFCVTKHHKVSGFDNSYFLFYIPVAQMPKQGQSCFLLRVPKSQRKNVVKSGSHLEQSLSLAHLGCYGNPAPLGVGLRPLSSCWLSVREYV